jgi:trimethylamine--corrinoid protein Co-methyltransferase
MLDFESCFSLEKLILDNEICGMVYRVLAGIEPKEDFPILPRFEELIRDEHLLISEHTLRYLEEEIHFPGFVIDRANRARWREEGSQTLGTRASTEIKRLVDGYEPIKLSEETQNELTKLMEREAQRYGMQELPSIENA